MLRNFLQTALRNIYRARLQSLIQVLSLAVGFTIAIFVGLHLWNELNYDRFNEKFDRIYRLEYDEMPSIATAIGHQIKLNFPDVEEVVRVHSTGGFDLEYKHPEDSLFRGTGSIESSFICDSTIFDVFSFRFLQGDPYTALKSPNSCVITIGAAKRLFGERDPMGMIMERQRRGQTETMIINGIIEDPVRSHINFELLRPFHMNDFFRSYIGEIIYPRGHYRYLNEYSVLWYPTYLVVKEEIDPSLIEHRINTFFSDSIKQEPQFSKGDAFILRKLGDIYLSKDKEDRIPARDPAWRSGNKNELITLGSIALIVMLLAIINYVNLATARATMRVKEVIIRKAMGSARSTLISQFVTESVLVAIIALLIALTLGQLLWPEFNDLVRTDITEKMIYGLNEIIIYLVFSIFIGMIAGMYPAIRISTVNTGMVRFVGKKALPENANIRRILLSVQFTGAMVFIIALFVIFSQILHMKNAELGFNPEGVILIDNARWSRNTTLGNQFRNELLENPAIDKVSFQGSVMGRGRAFYTSGTDRIINNTTVSCVRWNVDPGFFDLMEIPITKGRNFSYDNPQDIFWGDSMRMGRVHSIILNETAARAFGLKDPVDSLSRNPELGIQSRVIGVVKDFHATSPQYPIQPTVFWFSTQYFGTINVKIKGGSETEALAHIRKIYKSIFPDRELNYSMMKKHFDKVFDEDERFLKIALMITLIALVIACFGLFGLAFFMAARKTKEIGIRKSQGASNRTIFVMLSKEFIKWMTISILIAMPIGWFIMEKWLEYFAYRINVSILHMALAAFLAYAISFITVAWHAWKTARTNPVDALRYE